jgi:hypothetical protein
MALKVKKSEKAAAVAGAEENGGIVTVRSPMDAMVEKLGVEDGAWVETGAAAATLVDVRALRFRALAAASETAKLQDGMRADVGGVAGELRLGVGDGSGMTALYAVFRDGTAPGRSGERMKLECVLDMKETPVPALPDDCIVKIGTQPAVFVRDGRKKEVFHAIKVFVGLSDGGWSEVEGLPLDKHLEVVKQGVYGLKSALAAKSSGGKAVGHFHADGTFHDAEH